MKTLALNINPKFYYSRLNMAVLISNSIYISQNEKIRKGK